MKISGVFYFIMLILLGNHHTLLKIKVVHDAIEKNILTVKNLFNI